MIKGVIVFLLVMCAIALLAGPGFRRVMAKLLGIGPRRGR